MCSTVCKLHHPFFLRDWQAKSHNLGHEPAVSENNDNKYTNGINTDTVAPIHGKHGKHEPAVSENNDNKYKKGVNTDTVAPIHGKQGPR